MSTDTVPVPEAVQEEVVEQPVEQVEQETEAPVQEQKEEKVPLSALQKERRKRQEVEQELRVYKEQAQQKPAEPDESLFEAATKQDLGKTEEKIIRSVEERTWIKQNPEKASEVNEKLAEFLKQRPNLALAIENATNRYEEAWELMDKLSPKQKAALRVAAPKKDAPGSPAAMPKAAALNQSVDVMKMTDSEYRAWRQSQRRPR